MSFKHIKGQARPINILKGYIKSSTVAGAYLFIGPEGIGKSMSAHEFAKALNCQSEGSDSCGTCPSCVKIDKNQHPDMHFIDLADADAIKIEYIRGLKKEISLKPFEAKKKIFIINDAHNLTPEAANAILKILEEPPSDSLIILISSKPKLLFDTIVSRCKTIRFSPLSRQGLKEILKQDYNIDYMSAHFLAHFSGGSIGSALKLKDADMLREKNRIIDEFTLLRTNALESLSKQDRHVLSNQLNILVTWFRDIYLTKAGMPDSELINLDRKEQLLQLTSRYTFAELEGVLSAVSDSLLYLKQNVNVKLLLSNLKAQVWKEKS